MQFKIKGEKKKEIKEGFYLDIDTMLGDCDHYESITFGPFPKGNENYLEEVVNILQEMNGIWGDSEKYKKIKGFKFWFKECEEDNLDENDPRLKFIFEVATFKSKTKRGCYGWPSLEGCNYKLTNYKVFFLNQDGKKFEVEVVK